MSFFRNLDLYKGIILLCLVALPACGYWVWQQEQEITACKDAIWKATKPGGLLEQIGALQKKVELVVENRASTSDAISFPRPYFDAQILAAASQGLSTTDYGLSDPKEEPAVLREGKQRASDFVVDVTWKRKDLTLPLAFIYAVLFNCESGNKTGVVNRDGQRSVWKLRDLEIANATDDKNLEGYKTPPAELEDRWVIRKMQFARREPRVGR
jgi:hypothetical protein